MEVEDYKADLVQTARRLEKKRTLERVLELYSVFGVTTAVIAAGYFIVTLLPMKLSSVQQIVLAIAGIGFALGTMSRLLVTLNRERDRQRFEQIKETQDMFDFLRAWSAFEVMSKKALHVEDDVNRHSPRDVIRRLYAEGKLSDVDLETLQEAIRARNAVVHGGTTVPSSLARRLAELLFQITTKLAP